MSQVVGGGVIVSAKGYAVGASGAAPAQRRGIAAAAPERDGLDALLGAADFRVAADFTLTPESDAATRRAAAAPPAADIAVPVAPGEAAVLLVQDDAGLLSWHMPEGQAGLAVARRRGGTAAPQTLSFRLTAMPGARAAQPRRRGAIGDWIVDKVVEQVRVRVLRFLVGQALDAVVSRLEGDNPTGPVAIRRGSVPAEWVPAPVVAAGIERPVRRVLLLVHGTFSSTAGSFGALAGTPLFESWFDSYDLILGHDHRTLGDSPQANAEAILATLHALDLPADCRIDAIAFSRGGLVLRLLNEVLLPQSGLGMELDRAVFVGCTNAGTLLAEPNNWTDLLDIVTNLTVAAAKLGGLLMGPGAAAAVPWVTGAIRTIGRFAQLIPQMAISERRLPGLAAMEPDGETVLALNAAGAGAGRGTRYFAVTSRYEPDAQGGLGKRAAMVLADRAADRLLGEPNDLVVNTGSMTGFGPDREAVAVHHLGDDGHVFHTIYFASLAAMAPLADWLSEAPASAALAPENLSAVKIRSAKTRSAASGRRGLAGLAPESAAASLEVAPPEAKLERYIAAEMEPMPPLSRAANLYVSVSANPIEVGDHAAAAATAEPAELRRDRPVTVWAIPRRNCEIVGPDHLEIDAVADEEAIVRFRVRGLAAGPAELIAEARQGTQTLASFLLMPTFVSAEPLRESQRVIAQDPPAPDRAVLRIYEFKGAGDTTLRFDLGQEGSDLALLETVTLDPDFKLKDYAEETLKEVEDAWNLKTGDGEEKIYRSFLRRLSNKARDRTARLLPPTILRALWENRTRIHTIQVISEEPHIPWELLYLFDPDGKSDDGEGFFAERGLVRWLHNAPLRLRPPKLDGATSRYVIPAYLDQGHALPGAQDERTMLEQRLPGIQPVPASSEEVCAFLAGEARDCTLLHFSCHGQTMQGSAIDSALLMTELAHPDGSLQPDALSWQDVKEELDFGSGSAPLVFLNACQTGRGGSGIVGTAGFADAFIRPRSRRGASVFIGAQWSVDDRLASRFADTLYEQLGDGAALGDAVRAARKACQDASDFTWLAYSVYSFA